MDLFRLVPEREKSKETEASFPQAWSMIDFPNVKTSLDEAEVSSCHVQIHSDSIFSFFSNFSYFLFVCKLENVFQGVGASASKINRLL